MSLPLLPETGPIPPAPPGAGGVPLTPVAHGRASWCGGRL
jgi:hypothetical protein